MSPTTVRVLDEDCWRIYRSSRLAALTESPDAFVATYVETVNLRDNDWRASMRLADRLLAEREGVPLGIASVTIVRHSSRTAEVGDLWVTPAARNTGVASHLVQAAANQAARHGCTRLYYWVGTSNGRAIGFASNAGFRLTTERRSTLTTIEEFGREEIALVLSLANDPTAVPTSGTSPLTPLLGPR